MIANHSTSGFQKSIAIAFGLMFVLLALVLSYAAFSGKSDIRSKAAEIQIVHKQWEFNSASLEGWGSAKPFKIVVSGGFLTAIYQDMYGPLSLNSTFAPVSLPVGNKTLAISLAAGNPVVSGTSTPTTRVTTTPRATITPRLTSTPTPRPTGIRIPTGIKTPPPRDEPGFGQYVKGATAAPPVKGMFTGKLYYTLVNKSVSEPPIPFSGISDGVVREISIKFPEIGAIDVKNISLEFTSGLVRGNSVKIDWIRLQSPKITGSTNTPTPTSSICSTGLKDFIPGKSTTCKADYYLGMTYTCWDGTTGYLDKGVTCTSYAELKQTVTTLCMGKSNCPQVTVFPASCTPAPCKVPDPGCHYENATSCSCGTLVCSATPTSTPTGTPIPTPHAESAFKNAAKFDGASTYLKLAQSNTIQPKLGFTIEGMYKPTRTGSTGNFISKMNGSLNSIDIQIMNEIDPQDRSKVRFHYEFGVAGGGSCLRYTISHDSVVSLNQAFDWQHIAGVIQDSGKLDLFINGQRSTTSSNSISGVCSRDLPIVIGARELSMNSADSFLEGLIDEVRISKISRYPDNFYPLSVPFALDANTIALYHLDQFSDPVNGLVQDYSGNGYTGAQWGALSFTSH